MALYYLNGQWVYQPEKADHPTYENGGLVDQELLPTKVTKTVYAGTRPIVVDDVETSKANAKKNSQIQIQNKLNKTIDEDNTLKNAEAAEQNQSESEAWQIINATRGADYLQQASKINNASWAETELGKSIKDSFDRWYKEQKIGAGWNVDLGSKPPSGDFDPKYYLAENPSVKEQWDYAVKVGDLDITEQYKNINTFALQNYTYSGKLAGKRGNKAEELTEVNSYLEKKPTDADLQAIKDKQLGIGYEALKEVTPGTELEEIVSEELGADLVKKTKQFGALSQDALKDTIEEMRKAKAQEQFLSVMGGLPGFQEILNINQSISNSILGDSGVGGILSFTRGGAEAKESLEKSLQNMTGVNTSTIYNWQQWFDNNLKKQYEQDLELGLTEDEAEQKINIEANFAKQFIDQYLVPRFNQSKTISEFVDYINVQDEEQNPFQTQNVLNAAAEIGQLKAQSYLDQIKQMQDAYFDPEFYFNPNANLKSEQLKSLTGVQQQQEAYANQAKVVAEDWEEAKKQFAAQNGYWYTQAYKYGIDPTDKDAFAKLHFQVKGQAQGFDAAEDLWTPSKVQDYIYSNILPAVKSEVSNMSVFGEFLKPDEFTNNLLASANVDPNDKSTWNDVLQTFGLDSFQGSYDELKNYISDTFKTISTIEFNEQLKELQKKGIKPTQENLGVFYIARPTDTAGTPEGETALYKAFKQYGYAGNEEEFYTQFFPDLDFEEQKLLTQATGGSSDLRFIDLNTRDPFAALGAMEKLMGEEDGGFASAFSLSDQDEASTSKNYFKLGLEDEEEDYKSKTGAAILSDFTSFLKGF